MRRGLFGQTRPSGSADALVAGLHILKHAGNHLDEEVVAMRRRSPNFQYYCGEEFFRRVLPLDRSSMTRWGQRMGEEKVEAPLKESFTVALRTGAIKRSVLGEVVVDTTVQPKNVARPTDSRLLHRARESRVRKAGAAREFRCCTGFKGRESEGKALGSL